MYEKIRSQNTNTNAMTSKKTVGRRNFGEFSGEKTTPQRESVFAGDEFSTSPKVRRRFPDEEAELLAAAATTGTIPGGTAGVVSEHGSAALLKDRMKGFAKIDESEESLVSGRLSHMYGREDVIEKI